jgi:prepilin-type N-terminal cleavage/methylation domain-containing protein
MLELKKMKNKVNKRSFGFTLVELLVVISIMGILTVITASTFVGSQQKSRDAARKANLRSIADALNAYYADNGNFPAPLLFNPVLTSGGEFDGPDNVIYMKKLPTETVNSLEPFFYEGGNKSFRLYANLENTKDSDCHLTANCPNYFHLTSGCCYVVTSSNVNLNTSPLP